MVHRRPFLSWSGFFTVIFANIESSHWRKQPLTAGLGREPPVNKFHWMTGTDEKRLLTYFEESTYNSVRQCIASFFDLIQHVVY